MLGEHSMVITGLFRRLGEILVHERVTTPDVVEKALARSRTTGERVGEALVALGAVKDDEVLRALAQQQNLAYLTRDELPSPLPIVKNLSPKYLRQYAVCPVSVEGNVLTVATADPLNPVIVDDLAQSTGLTVKVVVSPADAIVEAIDRTYDGVATPLQRIVEGMEDDRGPEGDEDVNQLRDMAFEAPVVRLVNLLIENAINAEASDIHIEPFEDTLRIRYRIDGILFDQEAPPRRLQAAVTSRVKLMAEMNIAERRLPQDGRIRVTLRGRRVDIRSSTIPTVHGESIVMRLLDRQSVFLPLEKLGFAPAMLPRFESLIRRPHGIILVTGPTGSGKTTTLYAALDKINSPDRKIITVEDPVEYQLKGINQIAVKPKIGLTFATGLRHIVRQDPDVILIGEIRDLETAEIAIQARSPAIWSSRRSTPTTLPARSRDFKTWVSSPTWSPRCWKACSPSGSSGASARRAARSTRRRRPTSARSASPARTGPAPTAAPAATIVAAPATADGRGSTSCSRSRRMRAASFSAGRRPVTSAGRRSRRARARRGSTGGAKGWAGVSTSE